MAPDRVPDATRAPGAAPIAERLARWARIVRQVMGVPDYERYLAHERARHPEREPLARDAFMRERLAARYERPGARCC